MAVLGEISSDAFEAMAIRYSGVATIALWLYEYLLTIDDEIQLVWPSRLTIIKALFLVNRYLPVLVSSGNAYFLIFNTASNDHLCRPALLTIGLMSFVGFLLAEAVLVMRVYVIWQGRTLVLFFLIFLLSAKTVAAGAITLIYLKSAILSPIKLFKTGCENLFTIRIEWITIFVVFFFEIVLLTMMIVAKRAHLRRSRSEMVNILVKDGILYCLCIMAVSLINVLVVRLAPPILSPFLVITQGTLHNILCSRLLLRLRSADARRLSNTSGHIPLTTTSRSSTSRATNSLP